MLQVEEVSEPDDDCRYEVGRPEAMCVRGPGQEVGLPDIMDYWRAEWMQRKFGVSPTTVAALSLVIQQRGAARG